MAEAHGLAGIRLGGRSRSRRGRHQGRRDRQGQGESASGVGEIKGKGASRHHVTPRGYAHDAEQTYLISIERPIKKRYPPHSRKPNSEERRMPKVGMEPIRRQQLIEATITSISRYGYADATISRISKEAGVSTGIVHHYFGSKDDLLEAT